MRALRAMERAVVVAAYMIAAALTSTRGKNVENWYEMCWLLMWWNKNERSWTPHAVPVDYVRTVLYSRYQIHEYVRLLNNFKYIQVQYLSYGCIGTTTYCTLIPVYTVPALYVRLRTVVEKNIPSCEYRRPTAIMAKSTEMISLILVGAFWGCTNPLLRKGSMEEQHPSASDDKESSFFSTLKVTLSKFRKVRVWLPYALNQCGSLLFYYSLASSDLSMAVPVCNALSLVFSCITSYALGERVHQPVLAICGSALVMVGVAVCMSSQESITMQEKEPMTGELWIGNQKFISLGRTHFDLGNRVGTFIIHRKHSFGSPYSATIKVTKTWS